MRRTLVVPVACPIDRRIAESIVAEVLDRPARVVLVSVLRLPEPAEAPYDLRLRGTAADARELAALRELHALSNRLRGAGCTVTTIASWGPLVETIGALVGGFDAELLVPELDAPLPSADVQRLVQATPGARILRVPRGAPTVSTGA